MVGNAKRKNLYGSYFQDWIRKLARRWFRWIM